MKPLKTAVETVQLIEPLQIVNTLPTPLAGLADVQARLDAGERMAREAKARIAEIHVKRERLFSLENEIAEAKGTLEMARATHALHLKSAATLPDEIVDAFGKNDPTGGLTRALYGHLDNANLALADWRRVEEIYMARVEKVQSTRLAMLAEVEALLAGTDKPAVRTPAAYLKTEYRDKPGSLETEPVPHDANR